jgi:hypothetical protein
MRGEIQDEGAVRVARTLPNCEMAADDCESHIRMALPKSLELSPVAATFASQLRSPRSFLPIALNFPARHLPPVCALAGPPVGRTSASTPAVAATSTGSRGRRTIVVFCLPASTDGALFDAQAGTIRAT